MGKLICVCGTPGSGKTVTSLSLAKAIYRITKGAKVITVSPDCALPSLGYIFPNAKDDDMRSLGEILNRTDIDREEFERALVSVRTMKDFALTGYKFGENRFSYPKPTEDKAEELLSCALDLSDYVVVDCSPDRGDVISQAAKRDCDAALQLLCPDLRSIVSFYSSADEFFIIDKKKIRVLNISNDYPFLPVHEMKYYFRDIKYTIPFSSEIRRKEITGSLVEKTGDSSYENVIERIAGELAFSEKDPVCEEEKEEEQYDES